MESFRPFPLIEQDMPWVMTIPTSIPWSLPYYTGAQMTFTAKSVESHSRPMTVTSQMKRKGSHFDNEPSPSKIYISEEKMIARMKELNISPNNSTSIVPDVSGICLDDVDSGFIDMDDIAVSNDTKEPMLVLSEEIKNTIANPDPIIPTTLLNKIQKPSMELVLWTPPGGLVSSLIRAKTANFNTKLCRYNNNNNNEPNKEQQPVLKARKTLTSHEGRKKDFENSILSESQTQKEMEEMDL